MNQISFKRDFAYKFIKPTSFINKQEMPKIIIPLWRSNRLSIIRGYLFLERFFQEITLRKLSTITIKYKRSDKQTHRKTVFFFHVVLKDMHSFIFLLNHFPELEVLSAKQGYILVYPFYQFKMEIPCNINHHTMFVYRIMPYLREFELSKKKI
jgi:hypothetical protein